MYQGIAVINIRPINLVLLNKKYLVNSFFRHLLSISIYSFWYKLNSSIYLDLTLYPIQNHTIVVIIVNKINPTMSTLLEINGDVR